MENKILVDWLTCSTKNYDISGVFDIFGFHHLQERFVASGGKNFYTHSIRFGGIVIYFDGIKENMGICIEMTGQGCREWETFCNGDWYRLMGYVLCDDFKVSRLDFAFDDHSGILPITRIRHDVELRNYVSRMQKYKSIVSSEGESVEIGSRSSDCMIRIYDKAAERECMDGRHWVRCELQMRGDIAVNAGKELGKRQGVAVNELYFSILNNYLRFVVPEENDTQKRRWATTDYWNNFVEHSGVINLSDKLGIEYNLIKLEDYVLKQAGNPVDAYIEIVGVENFLKNLKSRSTSPNPKYLSLIEKHKQLQDHCNNGDSDCQ